MSQNFFQQIFMKSAIEPNFDMDNSKVKPIFPNFFIFIFTFASISQKWLKKLVKIFFLRYSWKYLYNLILIWRNQKSNSFFPNPFIFIFIFVSISQKCLTKWVKKIFLRFSGKLPYNLILIWIIRKSNSFSQFFPNFPNFLHFHLYFCLD